MSELLTTKEVMEFLKVCAPTLDKFRRYESLPIPFGRTGRTYVYHRADVTQWTKDNALMDPMRPVRAKYGFERRPIGTVAGTCESEEST